MVKKIMVKDRFGCAVEGCDKKHQAQGYCNKHYTRFKKYGDPLVITPRRLYGYEAGITGINYRPACTYRPWHAHLRFNKKQVLDAYFVTQEEAVQARLEAEHTHWN